MSWVFRGGAWLYGVRLRQHSEQISVLVGGRVWSGGKGCGLLSVFCCLCRNSIYKPLNRFVEYFISSSSSSSSISSGVLCCWYCK